MMMMFKMFIPILKLLRKMLIIGIDPGISGAICFFENGEIKDLIEMPTMADGKKNKKQINGPQFYNEIT